jgi:hypothetical protein
MVRDPDDRSRAERRPRWAGPAAAALTLGLLLPGLGWGTPSPERLRLLFPDERERSAALSALATALPDEPGATSPAESSLACVGPIDLTGASPAAGWLRTEMIPFLMSSDDPDEMETFASINKVFREPGRLDRRSFLYSPAYLATVATAEVLATSVGIVPRLPNRSDLMTDPELLRRLYLVGRATSLVAAALLAWVLVHLLVTNGVGPWVSLAGCLCMLGPMFVAGAHVTKPHMLAALLGFLSIALAWIATDRMRLVLWLAHAVTLALAISVSPPMAVLAIGVPVALLASERRHSPALLAKHAMASVAVGIVVLAAVNPLGLLHPRLFVSNATLHLSRGGWGYGVFGLTKLLAFVDEIARQGWPVAALPLVLLGGAVCAWRRTPFGLYLLILSACVCIVLGGFIGVVRIALVLAPLAAALGAVGVSWLAGLRSPRLRPAALLLTASLLLLTLTETVSIGRTYRQEDDRDTAGAWINAHIPRGRCIAARAGSPMATFLPRFSLQDYALQILPIDRPAPPDWIDADVVVLTAADIDADPWLGDSRLLSGYRVSARFSNRSPHGLLLGGWKPQGRYQVILLTRSRDRKDDATLTVH